MADGGVDFGRDGSARNVGAFPGRDLRCAEERGKWVFSPGESTLCAEDGYSPDEHYCCILNYNCVITRLKCQLSGYVLHLYE